MQGIIGKDEIIVQQVFESRREMKTRIKNFDFLLVFMHAMKDISNAELINHIVWFCVLCSSEKTRT